MPTRKAPTCATRCAGSLRKLRARRRRNAAAQHCQYFVGAPHDVFTDAVGIGAAATGADIERPADLGFDIAADRPVARDAALDRGEPVRLGVEPMEVAVENDCCRRRFGRGQPLDRGERFDIAVEPADHIKRIGGKIRRAREHRGRITVIARAEAAGLLILSP